MTQAEKVCKQFYGKMLDPDKLIEVLDLMGIYYTSDYEELRAYFSDGSILYGDGLILEARTKVQENLINSWNGYIKDLKEMEITSFHNKQELLEFLSKSEVIFSNLSTIRMMIKGEFFPIKLPLKDKILDCKNKYELTSLLDSLVGEKRKLLLDVMGVIEEHSFPNNISEEDQLKDDIEIFLSNSWGSFEPEDALLLLKMVQEFNRL